MNSNHFDDPIDARANAAADRLIASFADLDTESALREARSTAAAPHTTGGPGRWIALAAAAVLLVGGIVAIAATRSRATTPTAETPTTVASTIGPPILPAATTLPADTTVPIATTPIPTAATTVPVTAPTTTAAVPTDAVWPVSHLDPPPVLPIRPLATFSVGAAESSGFSAAIGDAGVIVGHRLDDSEGSLQLDAVGFDGQVRNLTNIDANTVLAYGPGDVAYLSRQGASIEEFAVVALPLSGDDAGTIVATEPADINEYLEYPPLSFGHGASGVVHRREFLAGTIVAPYVDTDGSPASLDADPASYSGELSTVAGGGFDALITASTGTSWRLPVDAAPDRANTYVGDSPPASGANGTGVFVTHIGPNGDPTRDFGEPTIWVMAVLEQDGTATWWSLPDGWQVIASDIWGTVLGRHTGTKLELALPDFESSAPCPNPPAFEPTALPSGMSADLLPGDGGQIVIGDDGEIEPIEPVDPAWFHYAGPAGVFINIGVGATPGLSGTESEPLTVLDGSVVLTEVEDGFAVRIGQTCGDYTIAGYGISRAEFTTFLEGLRFR